MNFFGIDFGRTNQTEHVAAGAEAGAAAAGAEAPAAAEPKVGRGGHGLAALAERESAAMMQLAERAGQLLGANGTAKPAAAAEAGSTAAGAEAPATPAAAGGAKAPAAPIAPKRPAMVFTPAATSEAPAATAGTVQAPAAGAETR